MTSDFVTLTCPSCGNKLQITQDIERFACGSCGNEHVVRRAGGAISLAPVVEGLRDIKVGVDKTASELAIPRLQSEISQIDYELTNLIRRIKQGLKSVTKPHRFKANPLELWIALAFWDMKLYAPGTYAPDLHQDIDRLSPDQLEAMLQFVTTKDPHKLFRTVFNSMQQFEQAGIELRNILSPILTIDELKSLQAKKAAELARHQQIVKI